MFSVLYTGKPYKIVKKSQLSEQKLEKKIFWTKMSAEQMSQFATKNYQFYKKILEKSIFLELEQNKCPSYDFLHTTWRDT